jgi:hypothetical protein
MLAGQFHNFNGHTSKLSTKQCLSIYKCGKRLYPDPILCDFFSIPNDSPMQAGLDIEPAWLILARLVMARLVMARYTNEPED